MPGARLGMGHLTYRVLISRLGRIRVNYAVKGWARAESCSIVGNMNGNPTTNDVSAVPQKRHRRKRGIVPKGGRVALTPRERKLHAQLIADGRLKSGRCGAYDFYERVQARVNYASLAIPANYAINVSDSPGIHRVHAVYSPCSRGVRSEIHGHAVNVTSA